MNTFRLKLLQNFIYFRDVCYLSGFKTFHSRRISVFADLSSFSINELNNRLFLSNVLLSYMLYFLEVSNMSLLQMYVL